VSLSESQRRVHDWVSQFEEGYFDPLTNLARLTEEVGELAREINHRFGQKTKKEDEAEGDLAMEMADILFVLMCIANREGLDLQMAFDRMMEKVETRDADRWTRRDGCSGASCANPGAPGGGAHPPPPPPPPPPPTRHQGAPPH
jgi:NTP pyrophosphatase (non-canonical NTP hydrolase)